MSLPRLNGKLWTLSPRLAQEIWANHIPFYSGASKYIPFLFTLPYLISCQTLLLVLAVHRKPRPLFPVNQVLICYRCCSEYGYCGSTAVSLTPYSFSLRPLLSLTLVLAGILSWRLQSSMVSFARLVPSHANLRRQDIYL
jgi:hypothetical protein